jgi:hypothetical protein
MNRVATSGHCSAIGEGAGELAAMKLVADNTYALSNLCLYYK